MKSPRTDAVAAPTRPTAGNLLIVATAFLLSGFAALLYQTSWMRMFASIFGTSEMAVITVLAAYMGGLGSGAWLAQRYMARVSSPIRVYALLELGIAIFALALPFLLDLNQAVLERLVSSSWIRAGSSTSQLTTYFFITAFLALMGPTLLMGATLPVLLRFVIPHNDEVGNRTAMFYALNTLGAVLGVLSAAFLFLPTIGLTRTVQIGVAANIIASALAFLLRKPGGHAINSQPRQAPTLHTNLALLCVIMAASGFVSFALEVTWTRLLGHVVGGSLYGFALMLATFLFGIALGSSLAHFRAREPTEAKQFLGLVQVAIAGSGLLSYTLIGALVPADRSLGALAFYCAAAMLPTTVLIGATFPLAVRAGSNDVLDAPVAAGRIYAANTLGAILGASVMGLLLLPMLGFGGSMRLTTFISAALGITLLWNTLLRKAAPRVVSVVILATLTFTLTPIRPEALVNASSLHARPPSGTESFFKVGPAATVIAHDYNGYINLRTNGLPEASIALQGMPPVRNSQQWLGALPFLANPSAEHFLIIGLGGGVALEGIPPAVERQTVVELERVVLEANESFEARRKWPILERSGTSFLINDARSTLSLSTTTYDVIVSQPSHPWTAGASHLYTREFFELARSRLNVSGVFLQWINTAFLGDGMLESLAATLTSVFPHVYLFEPAPGVLEFIASNERLNHNFTASALERQINLHRGHFSRLGINSHLDILAAYRLDDKDIAALSGSAPVNTDDFNLLATSRAGGSGSRDGEPSPDIQADAFCGARQPTGLSLRDRFYVHRQWQLAGFDSRSAKCAQQEPQALQALVVGHAHLVRGNRKKANPYFQAASRTPSLKAASQYLESKTGTSGSPGDNTQTETSARATLMALRAAAAGDWKLVRELDIELARTDSIDPWYGDAARLMAEWRIRRAVETGQRMDLEVSMAIIDSALATQWSDDLLVLRAGVAALSQDADALYASIAAFAERVEYRLENARLNARELSAIYRQNTSARLSGMRRELDSPWLRKKEDNRRSQSLDRVTSLEEALAVSGE